MRCPVGCWTTWIQGLDIEVSLRPWGRRAHPTVGARYPPPGIQSSPTHLSLISYSSPVPSLPRKVPNLQATEKFKGADVFSTCPSSPALQDQACGYEASRKDGDTSIDAPSRALPMDQRGERCTPRGGVKVVAFQSLPLPAYHSSPLHLAASWLDKQFAYLLTQRQGVCNSNEIQPQYVSMGCCLADSCSPGALTSIITLLNHRRLKSHAPTPALLGPSSTSPSCLHPHRLLGSPGLTAPLCTSVSSSMTGSS